MRVFVTVGTHPQQFNRLLQAIDEIAARKKVSVFAQTGNSDFEPKNFGYKKFLPPQEMREKISESDVVVSHGGAGSIIGALEQKKALVVVPRLKEFKEHTNNHQLDLAIAMQKAKKAIAVMDVNGLEKALESSQKFSPENGSGGKGIVAELEKFFGSGK